MRAVEGIANPAVGLLNIGAEATKGSQLTIAAHEALSDSSLGFIGNVEGSDLFLGDADVVVTDGFTGNVALKLAEGWRRQCSASCETLLGAHCHRGWAAS